MIIRAFSTILFAYVVCLAKVIKQFVINWLCYIDGIVITCWACSTTNNWFTYFKNVWSRGF